MKLDGLNVVLFEARHAKTLADLIAKQGGNAFSAPAMKEVPLENNVEAFRFAEKLFKGEIDIMILLTGVGTRYLVSVLETKYPREKILDVYKRIVLIPRGPKPIRVLNEWGIPFAFTVPEPNTWREILKTIDENPGAVGATGRSPLHGKTVAVQEYGVPNPELVEGLEKRGARVLRVPVYRWALPDDTGPIKEAIRRILDGKADVAMFTTAVQIQHVFQVAEQMGTGVGAIPATKTSAGRHESPLHKAFKKIVVASVGPDCTEALRSHGIEPDIEPESPKMGPLVLAMAEKAKNILHAKQNARR